MKTFGAIHGLEFHGGIDKETYDGRTQLNAYLAQGYSYTFGDKFDLWFTSDLFRADVVTLGGIIKKRPVTPRQQKLASDLLAYVNGITTPANGPPDSPSCSSEARPSKASKPPTPIRQL